MDECIEPTIADTVCDMIISPKLAAVLLRDNRIRQHTKLWFTTRTRLITCSDAASVLGQNPYSTRKAVFKKKTGQSRPFKGNHATRRGTQLEAEAITMYEKKSGKKVWPDDIGLAVHKDYPMIGGSPDGITLDGMLVEVKCPLTRQIVSGHCPAHYLAQLQILMEIFDLDTAHFVQYRPGNVYTHTILDITVVKRDPVFWSKALPVLQDFMAEVFEFYDNAQLPVGTPMVDWDVEDDLARADKKRKRDSGHGTICKFINSPNSNKRRFVMDTYSGPDNEITHREFVLDETILNTELELVDVHVAAEGVLEAALADIVAQMPERCRPSL